VILYLTGPLLGVSGIPLLSAKNIILLRSVSGIYVFFTNKADLLVLGLIWEGVEVICILLYVNYSEKNIKLNEKVSSKLRINHRYNESEYDSSTH
jgi:hypothetical protein